MTDKVHPVDEFVSKLVHPAYANRRRADLVDQFKAAFSVVRRSDAEDQLAAIGSFQRDQESRIDAAKAALAQISEVALLLRSGDVEPGVAADRIDDVIDISAGVLNPSLFDLAGGDDL